MRGSRVVIAALAVALVATDVSVAAVRAEGAHMTSAVVMATPLRAVIPPRAYDVAPPLVMTSDGITPQYSRCQLSSLSATAQLKTTET